MLRRGVSYAEAERYLRAKTPTPTTLTAQQYLTLWNSEARRKAFFSARVASVDLLSTLQKATQAVVDGQASEGQAVEWLRDFAKNQGRDTFAKAGWAPAEEARGITELASYRRLELVVYQNTKIAHEVGAYQQWAATQDVFPYGRWRLGPSETHRPEHVKLDGNIYPFDHPIWRQSPPGSEFGCKCWRELLTEEQAKQAGVQIQPKTSPIPDAQVKFDPAAGLDIPPPIKKETPPALVQEVKREIPTAIPEAPILESAAPLAVAPVIGALLDWLRSRRTNRDEDEQPRRGDIE